MSIQQTIEAIGKLPQARIVLLGVADGYPVVARFGDGHTLNTDELKALAADYERLRQALGNCIAAIELLPPDVFGIGGGMHEGKTAWFIRDELLKHSREALSGAALDAEPKP